MRAARESATGPQGCDNEDLHSVPAAGRLFLVFLYFVALFLSPQMWLEPFVGLRIDLIIYPSWIAWTMVKGRAGLIFKLDHQDWFFVALIAWTAVSIVVTPDSPRQSEILLNYCKWFLLYRLLVVTLPTFHEIRKTMLLIVFFAVVLAFESYQHVSSPDGIGWAGQGMGWVTEAAKGAGVGGRTQWTSIFDGPGTFCVVFTVALPLALQYLGKPFSTSVRLAGAALVAVLLLGTLYTGSRGGFLATLGVFGLFFAMKFGVSPGRIAVAVMMAIAALVAAPEHLTQTRDSHGSAQNRVNVWAKGIKMAADNPVFGIGKGNYARETGTLIAHNSMLEIAAETGYPGLFCWLGLIYLGFKKLLRVRRELLDPAVSSYAMALSLSIAGYLMSAMFVTLEYETFYVLLALTCAFGNLLPTPTRFLTRDLTLIGTLIIGLMVVMKLGVMAYY